MGGASETSFVAFVIEGKITDVIIKSVIFHSNNLYTLG